MMSIKVHVMRCTRAGNVQNMKPVQCCTGFIFCTFPEIVRAKYSFHIHFRLQEVEVKLTVEVERVERECMGCQ